MSGETIATYEDGGQVYEIDHLGIGYPDTQWGNFAVYRGNVMIAEFCIPESSLAPEFRPAELPCTREQLVEHAKGAVRSEYASDQDVAAYLEVQGMIGRNLPGPN